MSKASQTSLNITELTIKSLVWVWGWLASAICLNLEGLASVVDLPSDYLRVVGIASHTKLLVVGLNFTEQAHFLNYLIFR